MTKLNFQSETFKRIWTGAIGLPIIIACVLYSHLTTLGLSFTACLLALFEWLKLSQGIQPVTRGMKFLFIGNAYIIVGCALIWLVSWQVSTWASLFLVALAFASDTGGYIFGRTLGGPKLAPSISPGKTQSGAIGSLLFSTLFGVILYTADMSPLPFITNAWAAGVFCAFASIFAQGGDLLESWAKRQSGLKDSSQLIPGHGGILDRLDSILSIFYLAGFCLLIS